jgi:TPR repeat protein
MQRSGRAAVTALVISTISLQAAAQPDPSVARELAAARAKAAAGDAIAQFSLGSVLYYGTRDTVEAVDWFRKAAAQGVSSAEFQMGPALRLRLRCGTRRSSCTRLVQEGSRTRQRRRRAIDRRLLLERPRGDDGSCRGRALVSAGADGDDLRAQYQLGQMYFDGTGLTRDYESAYMWFTLAAGQTPLTDNRKQLIEMRNIAAARMTPAQVAAAVRRVEAWKPRPPAR